MTKYMTTKLDNNVKITLPQSFEECGWMDTVDEYLNDNKTTAIMIVDTLSTQQTITGKVNFKTIVGTNHGFADDNKNAEYPPVPIPVTLNYTWTEKENAPELHELASDDKYIEDAMVEAGFIVKE